MEKCSHFIHHFILAKTDIKLIINDTKNSRVSNLNDIKVRKLVCHVESTIRNQRSLGLFFWRPRFWFFRPLCIGRFHHNNVYNLRKFINVICLEFVTVKWHLRFLFLDIFLRRCIITPQTYIFRQNGLSKTRHQNRWSLNPKD